ncbi:GRAM domain-containing protein 2B isoform X3 [Cryptotermes secundus]|uniref:GRAM domain-containing protein 2B isoform X3 n=1 Tax=Cryptotermes secundus TaxID=105785 RepID=UPI001454E367|nr:GRAM domain-containing protein 2B isoform X3 [Cryptotermes secundus]
MAELEPDSSAVSDVGEGCDTDGEFEMTHEDSERSDKENQTVRNETPEPHAVVPSAETTATQVLAHNVTPEPHAVLPSADTTATQVLAHNVTPEPHAVLPSADTTATQVLAHNMTPEPHAVLPSADTTATQVLAHNVLQLGSIPLPAAVGATPLVSTSNTAPTFVEAPPSSDDNEDGPGLRVVIDSRFLNGSSSNLLAKSAPSTPQGERLQAGTPFLTATQTTAAVGSISRSPSHVFNKHDKQALKQLSVSVPVMTQARPQPATDPLVTPAGPPSPEQQPGSSKSRQKKFHRHFKQVAAEEHVLNYYSCALVGDILLQGHLYITKNYFAFYSNVFGYVTKLLIPTVSVIKISKEKTARIIPNAIGVATEDDKHVFCSLLSRDSTYTLMVQVWKTATIPGPQNMLSSSKELKDEVDSASGDIHPNEDDSSSGSGSEHSCPPTPVDSPTDVSHSESCTSRLPNGNVKVSEKPKRFTRDNAFTSLFPQPTLILIIATGLLVLLFLSAAFLLYRIGRIHHRFPENPVITGRFLYLPSDEVYQEILKWQTHLHTKSANEVQEFLNANLDQLAKVRQSLEALSLLIVTDDSSNKSPVIPEQSSQQSNPHHHQQATAPLPREKHS